MRAGRGAPSPVWQGLRHSRYDLAELGFAEGAMGLGAHVAFAFHSERKLRHDLVRRGLHNQEGIVLTHQVIEGLHLRALGVESLLDRLESFGRGLHVLGTLMRVAGQNHECCHSCLPPKQDSSQTVTDRGCLRTLGGSRPARTLAVSQNSIRLECLANSAGTLPGVGNWVRWARNDE